MKSIIINISIIGKYRRIDVGHCLSVCLSVCVCLRMDVCMDGEMYRCIFITKYIYLIDSVQFHHAKFYCFRSFISQGRKI